MKAQAIHSVARVPPISAHTALDQRKVNRCLVDAARELASLGHAFRSGTKLPVVGKTWFHIRTAGEPKFTPADLIESAFVPGQNFAYDCNLAILLINYRAILNAVGRDAFNRLFATGPMGNIFNYKQPHARLLSFLRSQPASQLVTGGNYYFRNPDVSPKHYDFAGENAIYLGRERNQALFYAHGMVGTRGAGLVTRAEIIEALSSKRISHAKRSPYLDTTAVVIDAEKITAALRQLRR